MFKLKRTAAFVLSLAMTAALLSGCGDKENSSSDKTSGSDGKSSAQQSSGKLMNFTPPEEGEEIIVMTIKDYGDVKIKLFPEQAEKGVENFTGLAEKGYYDTRTAAEHLRTAASFTSLPAKLTMKIL